MWIPNSSRMFLKDCQNWVNQRVYHERRIYVTISINYKPKSQWAKLTDFSLWSLNTTVVKNKLQDRFVYWLGIWIVAYSKNGDLPQRTLPFSKCKILSSYHRMLLVLKMVAGRKFVSKQLHIPQIFYFKICFISYTVLLQNFKFKTENVPLQYLLKVQARK